MRLLAPALIAITITGCAPSADEQFLAACEQAIKAKLVAPSGFRRIGEAGAPEKYEVSSANLAQSAARFGVKLTQADYDALGELNGPTPVIYQRVIEYDAPNSFNAPIRSTARCMFFSIDGKATSVAPYRIAVADAKP